MGGASNSSTSTTKRKPGGAASLRADTFTVSIPKGMAGDAVKAAKELGITKAQLVKRALADMLEEIRDIAESERIMADIKSGKEKSIPWEKVKAELGI